MKKGTHVLIHATHQDKDPSKQFGVVTRTYKPMARGRKPLYEVLRYDGVRTRAWEDELECVGPKPLTELAQYARRITDMDGRPILEVFLGTVAELGEFAQAVASEDDHLGRKRELNESSAMEAVDLIVAGLALYGLRGGEPDELSRHIFRKMTKWAGVATRALAKRKRPASRARSPKGVEAPERKRPKGRKKSGEFKHHWWQR